MVLPFFPFSSSQSLVLKFVVSLCHNFCSVFLCPVPTCIHMYHHHPESLTFHPFFFLFSSTPNIYFSLLSVLKLHTSLHDTPYPFLVSPLTTPPFSCYDPLLIHLCALDISYAHLVSKLSLHLPPTPSKRYALSTRSRFRIRKVFSFAPPLSRYPTYYRCVLLDEQDRKVVSL